MDTLITIPRRAFDRLPATTRVWITIVIDPTLSTREIAQAAGITSTEGASATTLVGIIRNRLAARGLLRRPLPGEAGLWVANLDAAGGDQ